MSTTEAPAVRRRKWVNDPETLLLSSSPLRDIETVTEAAKFLGAAPGDLLMSRMCTVPLLAPEAARPVRDRFPAGTRADALWHPLLWLPPGVAARRTVDRGNGPRPEYDDGYAIRVAVTLIGSALFDPEDGTWTDVLSLAGLDGSRSDHAGRIRAWLDGGDDPDLDRIDLTGLIPPAADQAGTELATAERDLMIAGMHRAAHDLAGMIDGVADPRTGQLASGTDAREASFTLHLAATAAVYAFSPLGDPETATWQADAARAMQASTPESLAWTAREMRARLAEIADGTRETFGAAVSLIGGYDSAGGQDRGGAPAG